MQILFCERCGMRVSPGDLDSGRCKREEMSAWCPACTKIVASQPANTPLAEVIASPPARTVPDGAMPAGSGAVPTQHVVPGRPSMLTPPGEEIMRGRRPTTGQHYAGRRPPSGTRPGVRPGSSPPPRKTPASPARGTRVYGASRKPLPAGEIGSPAARRPSSAMSEVQPPPRDNTMIYIAVGVSLLVLGLIMLGYALNNKSGPPEKNPPTKKSGA